MADITLETRAGTGASSLPPPVVNPNSNQPGRSSSRDSSGHSRSSNRSHSRRSRSNGSHSRSRHRHSSNRRQNRRTCRFYFKHKERNFAAATSSMVAIVLLCTALVPDWVYMKGGGCHVLYSPKGSLNHLSASQFFYSGHFYESHPFTDPGDSIYHFSTSSNDIMVNCVTYPTVLLFKACIAFTLIAICCSLVAFMMDLIGPEYHVLMILRRNAIFNILSVILCVTVNLLTYWITTMAESLQRTTRLHAGSKVEVTFDSSFYLITAAGGISVMATACNCLRRHSMYSVSRDSHPSPEHLMFDDAMEALLPADYSDADVLPPHPVANYPPPPVYTP